MRPRRLLRALPPVALVLVLAGCAARPPATFGSQEGVVSTQCVHLDHDGRALVGDVLRTGDAPVTIRSATLRDAEGVRVVRSWVVHNPDGLSFGVTDVPPDAATAAQIGWSTRRAAAGDVVAAHTERNIVLEVEKTAGSDASAAASAIRVVVASSPFDTEVDSGVRYRFPGRC